MTFFQARSSRRLFALVCGAAMLALSCGPASRQDGQASGEAAADKSSGPKTLRMAVVDEPRSGIAVFSAGGTGGADPSLTFHSGLTVYDDHGQPTPRLAAKVPRLEDGDWAVLPDGRMELTWKLRPNVKWHDGTPLSAEDFLFGVRLLRDDEIPATRAPWLRLVTDVTAPDAETLVVSWRQSYIQANASGPTDIPAVPRHLMQDLYQAGDKQAFINNLYWTREFVGLGPFKMGDWQLGSYLEGFAFDDYFLGRPKVDRVVTHYFPDVNALVASLLAGEIDVVPAGALKTEQIVATKQNWEAAGKGTVTLILNGLRVNWFQYRDPTLPWAADVRVRQALVHMLDRQAIAETLEYGLTTVADTLPTRDEPLYAAVQQRGLASYPYDLTRADRLLGDAGWTKGSSGQYRNAAGQPFTIEVRTVGGNPENQREILTLSDLWTKAGLNGTSYLISNEATNAQKDELRSKSEGVFANSIRNQPEALSEFHSAQISSEATRWRGNNRGGHSDPAFDRLYDQYIGTLEAAPRQSLLAHLLKMTADDVIFIPMYYYFGTVSVAVRNGVRGPGPINPIQLASGWNIHAWEMD